LSAGGYISVQILNEFAAVAGRVLLDLQQDLWLKQEFGLPLD
jgi:hypothetical protein